MSQSSLNLQEIFEPIRESLEEPDSMLGKGLMMPNNNTNSGARKILFGIQREHVIPLKDAEVAYVQTGEEDEFGKYSSSIRSAKGNYKLIAKIPKFSSHPDHHYFSIFLDCDTDTIEVEERKCYKHITESYGYTLNNNMLDKLNPGDKVMGGTILQKSDSFDDHNNRKDGLNLSCAYISCDNTMEDGIVISESTQKRMVTPLVHYISMVANDNDIPLNLFGGNDKYKIIPDIGEYVPQGILMGLRREDREEILFSQTYSRLQDIMMSDDKFTVEGKVVDIDVYCNNPDNIANNPYYAQVKYYYDENQKFCRNLVSVVDSLCEVYTLSYEVQKLYYNSKKQLEGIQFLKDRPFSNVIIDIVLIEDNMINVGDKVSDRYGGKGVIVKVLSDHLMPRLDNGKIVDMIVNKSTCVNRLNVGQLFEVEVNHIAQRLLEYMESGLLSTHECIHQLYLEFIKGCSEQEYEYMSEYLYSIDDADEELFLDDLLLNDGIYQSLRAISDSFTLDKLSALYAKFPWVKPYEVEVPMHNSKGEIVYKKARRPIICGAKYIYRLKQYAREKFSVCSLSSTNIRNENSRSKANKMHRGLYTKTPIRFGEMETGNMGHMGMEYVIIDLLLYSASPHARRMAGEEILTGDPFNIDVKLDTDCTNTGVQILNTLFKTIGLRLVFEKHKIEKKQGIIKYPLIKYNEQYKPVLMHPLVRLDPRAYYDKNIFSRIYDTEFKDGLIVPLLRYPLIKNLNSVHPYDRMIEMEREERKKDGKQ